MMRSYSVIPATLEHVLALTARLREADIVQATCMGITGEHALRESFRHSVVARTGIVDGEIAVIGGVGGALLGAVGEPWLLTSPAVERVPLALVKECRREVATWLDMFGRLEGNVLASYTRAIRFAETLGFEIGEPFTWGPKAVLWRPMSLER